MRAATERALDRFADWFGSLNCVLWTLGVCGGLAAFESAIPSIDPSNLHYLYALSVYSAVTQPALAYAAERLGSRLLELLSLIRETIGLVLELARNHADTQEALATQNETIAVQTEAIAAALEELRRHLNGNA